MLDGDALRGARILVTGTSGFIGAALARALNAGGAQVWGWSRSRAVGDCCAGEIIGDLLDPAAAATLPEAFDGIVHLAGVAAPGAALDDPVEAIRTNTVGSARLLAIARDRSCPLVFASSVYVYDGCEEFPWHEDLAILPRSPLGASKIAAEAIARSYASCFGMNVIGLRFFTVYGPGSRPTQFIPSALARLAVATGPVAFGPGDSTRDFVYIDDVVSGILLALAYARSHPGFDIVNLASGTEREIREVVGLMIQVIGREIEVEFDSLPARIDEPTGRSRHWASIDKARRVLGWEPRIGLVEGLRRTYAAMNVG